ncbi:M20/M25/M40 family metallo-hydrolase [Haliangium sp.]|uniref:M20/M25/M40 family metallo-hydrolase n=1 Tax=Haliangium sp. TaxID=2663208 RepID=UPI003D10C2D7
MSDPADRDSDGLVARALAAAQRRHAEMLPLLERWVRQNSFSDAIANVNAMGALLHEGFALDGLSVERIPGEGVGDHLVWRTPAWDRAPDARQMLIGHHDTVFPPGTFEVWEPKGDILRGPGVLDMKGGLVVIRTALAALADVGALTALPLAVVSVGDEEIGSRHSSAFVQGLARGAKAALVFEAGRADDVIITQRKGTGRVTVHATGKAAHAGNHHAEGVNAIWALARFVDRVQRLTDYDAGLTVNVGLIEGGSTANTVPAQASCTIDFRYLSAEAGQVAVHGFEAAAAEIGADTGAGIEVVGGIRRLPLQRTEASLALYRAYAAAARGAGLGDGECPLIGGGSDANTVSAVGVPAIDGLGPRGRGFHTHDEYIEISSLALRVEALVRYLLADAEA